MISGDDIGLVGVGGGVGGGVAGVADVNLGDIARLRDGQGISAIGERLGAVELRLFRTALFFDIVEHGGLPLSLGSQVYTPHFSLSNIFKNFYLKKKNHLIFQTQNGS